MATPLPPIDFADTSADPWSRKPERSTSRRTARRARGRRWPIVVIAVLAVLAAMAIGALAYCEDGYVANEEALAAAANASGTTAEGWLAFGNEDAPQGIVFYPGARVDAEAYAPLMTELARKGMFCVLVDMPFDMAFFDMDAADGVQRQFPGVGTWYLAGHSLGGAMAASYLSSHADDWAGLILLASYSTADLSGTDLAVLSITGTNDGVVNRAKQAACEDNLPATAQSIPIQGGNHAGFGSYGDQDGDDPADIPASVQQQAVAQAVAGFVDTEPSLSKLAQALIAGLAA